MKKTELSKNDILEIIPHRSPVLLADSAVLEDEACTSSFYVSPDMDIFKGHFPGEPVLPGVCIIEAMAQCAGILLLSDKATARHTPLLASVGRMRFFRPVCPGDTLTCRAEILAMEIRDIKSDGSVEKSIPGLFDFQVYSYTGGKKTAQGMITLCLK